VDFFFPIGLAVTAAIFAPEMKKLIGFIVRKVPRKYLQLVSGIGLKVLGLFYRGSRVKCPICESSFREFLPTAESDPEPMHYVLPACHWKDTVLSGFI
jgi:hypothetical protein